MVDYTVLREAFGKTKKVDRVLYGDDPYARIEFDSGIILFLPKQREADFIVELSASAFTAFTGNGNNG